MGVPSLELVDVSKSFGAIDALKGVSLSARPGEFLVLVGPSGCGKSTLLRLIAGFEGVTDGSILINDKLVNDVDPRHRDIAMVFQSYALYPHMTVAENIAFPLKMRGLSKTDARSMVDDVGTTTGLDGLLDRYPRQLSGGQRQRVAMGRAIIREPTLFLFDEPLSNLDAALRIRMRIEIKELHQRVGSTAVYVTHDQIEAMTMADRVVVMNEGRIEQIGTGEELYDAPVNMFVAQFIGSPSMNNIPAVYRNTDEGCRLMTEDGERLEFNLRFNCRDGQEVSAGIRPEHVVLSEQNGLSFTVEISEMLGRENLIYGTVADRQICVATGERVTLSPGDRMRLTTKPGNLHLFDRESGGRLS